MTTGCAILVGIALLAVYSPKAALWVALVGAPTLLLVNYLPNRGLRRRVEERSQQLRELPYEVLREMKGEAPEFADVGTRLAEIQVVVEDNNSDTFLKLESNSSDKLRVLVRGSVEVLFYSLVRFDGFYKSRDGAVRPMHRDEYDDYD